MKRINLFGECNAFETNWYNEETIETVEILSQWSESIVKNSFHKYEDWKPYLDILDNYPDEKYFGYGDLSDVS